MIFYSEKKDGRRTVYVVTSINDETGEIIAQRTVVFPLYQLDYEGFKYFLLYDDNMVPVREVYEYLNFALRDSPLNTRSKTAHALRLLYCFLSLYQHSIANIDEKTFVEFIYFIRGHEFNPKEYSLITFRNNGTVDGYFAVYRSFFKHMGIECQPLFSSRKVFLGSAFSLGGSKVVAEKYTHNLKQNKKGDTYIPKYISPEEFKRIYSVVQEAGDKQAELLIHLMYGYGLRLGEALGLTLEDICEVDINNKTVPVLFLRNRMSDQRFQHAKGLPHVTSKRQYKSKDYKSAHSKIIITRDTYRDLLCFLDNTFEEIQEKNPSILSRAEADLVSDDGLRENNYYIFLNSYGKPLSDQVWNKKIREYFILCQIPTDTGFRENNLSHRFRHGFAMFYAHFSKHPVNEMQLQRLMRHKSIDSTMVYYNPTPDDEQEIKERFQEERNEILPNLRGETHE